MLRGLSGKTGLDQTGSKTAGTCARHAAELIYASSKDAQGLWYGSSMAANTPSAALLERAAAAPAFQHALTDATLEGFLIMTAAALGYRLAI